MTDAKKLPMSSTQSPAQWPMYQGNAQRSGAMPSAVLPTTFVQAFSPLSLPTAPVGVPAVDANGLIYVCDGSADGVLYCVAADGALNWHTSTGMQITSNGPLIGPDGTLYVAGSSVAAFSATGQKFTFALGANLVCTGPMALSADGSTLYIAAANSATGNGTVIALALPSSSGAQPAQAWIANLSGQVASGIAIAADGTLYAGGTSGQLFSVSATGTAALAATGAGGCLVATPAIDTAGTVHYLCLDPQQFNTALYAYQPDRPNNQKSFAPKTASLTVPNGPGATAAVAPDGSIYVSIDRIYQLAWSVASGYSQTWAGNPSTDHGATPGAPVIDSAGGVAVFGSDGWLVSYSAAGTLAWHQAGSAANPYLALTEGGAIVFLQDTYVTATTFGGNATLNTLYAALKAAATPGENGNDIYPLNSASIADSAILALVSGALGTPSALTLTGSMTYTGASLTLTGATVWAPVASVPSPVAVTGSLTFSAAGSLITLNTNVTAGANFDLAQAIPNLAGAFWGQQSLAGFNIAQSASTAQAATCWNVSANVELAGSLALAAALFDKPPANVAVSGQVAVDDAGNPTVSLTASETFTLLGGWTLPAVTLALLADSDAGQGLIVSTIQLSVQIAVAGQNETLYAVVPATAGTVTFGAVFDPPLGAGSVSELISWLSPGLASGLTLALPTGIGTSGFGLSLINATLVPATCQVANACVVFTAPAFTIFSVSSPGVSLMLSQAEAFATVINPLGDSPAYHVGLAGQIVLDVNSSPVLTIDADVTGPDWDIAGTIAPGSSGVSPVNAIAAMGGSTTLPAGTPSSNFEYVKFFAQPQHGIYSVGFIGTDTWPLFTIGDFSATFGNFSLQIDRIIADPSTHAGLVTVDILGCLTLAGTGFGLTGSVDSLGNWQFGAVLGSAVALPSIGELVGAVSNQLAGDLPSAIADLGSNIVMRQLALSLGNSGTNSLALDIGSGDGWGGWTILSTPFNFAITDALAKIKLDSSKSPVWAALIEGTFAIGTSGAGLRVQVPLPFSSDQFLISLVSKQDGVAVPSVAELVGYFSQPLAQSLPSAIAGLGSGITVSAFSVALQTQPSSQTTVQFQLGANNASAQWSPIGLNNLSLGNLALGTTVTFASSTTTQIDVTGTLTIGQAAIPLKASATDFNSFTLALDGDPVQMPTIGDFIEVVSPAWEKALPSNITGLGSGLDLKQISLERVSASDMSGTIQVGATFSWQPIPKFADITFTGFTLTCDYASATGWAGSIAMDLKWFDQKGQISVEMPKLKFRGTVGIDMQTVCQAFMGGAAPTWLQAIGTLQLNGAVDLTAPEAVSLGINLGNSIDIGFLGSLTSVVVSANFGGGKAACVCLSAIWCPPGSAQIPGSFCYPFDKFKLPGDQEVDIPDDPADEPSPPSPIPPGSAVAVAGAIAAGSSVATAFLCFVFGGSSGNSSRQTQPNADTTCAQGAMIHFGANPTASQLAQTIQALMQTFPGDNTTDLALALYRGAGAATPAPVSLSDGQIAAALAGGMSTSTSAALVGAALLQIWTSETPKQMVAALAGASYPAAATGLALQSLYPAGANACVTAPEIYAALETGSFTPAEVMTALYQCQFSATECVPLFTTIATAAAMAPLLASAGFPVLNAANALSIQYPADVATAAEMVSVLTAQGAYGTIVSTDLWACLYNSDYPTLSVLTAMKTGYPAQYATAAALAADAVATGYSAQQIAMPLASLYSLNATGLADALLSAVPALTAAALMSDLNAAQCTTEAAAAAFVAEAPNHWSSQNNAQGLANALASGSYHALGILKAEAAQFSASIGTALSACQILYNTSIVTEVQARNALLSYGFAPGDVASAIKKTYG